MPDYTVHYRRVLNEGTFMPATSAVTRSFHTGCAAL